MTTGADIPPANAPDSPQAPTRRDRPRWVGYALVFVAQTLFFGLGTELLDAWWGAEDDPGFSWAGVLIRGSIYATLMLAYTLWADRRKGDATPDADAAPNPDDG